MTCVLTLPQKDICGGSEADAEGLGLSSTHSSAIEDSLAVFYSVYLLRLFGDKLSCVAQSHHQVDELDSEIRLKLVLPMQYTICITNV